MAEVNIKMEVDEDNVNYFYDNEGELHLLRNYICMDNLRFIQQGSSAYVLGDSNGLCLRVPKDYIDYTTAKNFQQYSKILKDIFLSNNKILNIFDIDLYYAEESLGMINSVIGERTPFRRAFELDVPKIFYTSSNATDMKSVFKNLNLQEFNHIKSYCVEIKPKQGWKFNNEFKNILNPQDVPLCRYNAMQYLKLKESNPETKFKVSDYCPINLFSGSYRLMFDAVIHLFENPQNNFRFFSDGNQLNNKNMIEVLNAENLNIHSLANIILACLLSDGNNNTEFFNKMKNLKSLPQNCSLKTVLEMQYLAKNYFMETYKICQEDCSSLKTYDIMDNLLKRCDQIKTISDLDPREKYMIGATAMDLSLMVTFTVTEKNSELHKVFVESEYRNHIFELEGNKIIIFSVNLLDLDPKSDQHIKMYIDKTNESYECARNNSNQDTIKENKNKLGVYCDFDGDELQHDIVQNVVTEHVIVQNVVTDNTSRDNTLGSESKLKTVETIVISDDETSVEIIEESDEDSKKYYEELRNKTVPIDYQGDDLDRNFYKEDFKIKLPMVKKD